MDTNTFVESVKRHLIPSAVESTLQTLRSPAGRQPPENVRTRSHWYNELSESDRELVGEVVGEAVQAAIFNLFAVLDRSKKLVDVGHFELFHVDGETRVLLNDFAHAGLNEIFNAD